MEVIYLDVVDGPDGMLKIMQRIGKRAPMHSTGVGKLLLTQYTPQQLQALIDSKGLVRLTQHTKASPEDLAAELAAIRARGYAFDDEECELGARCVATPIRDYADKIVAAISISGPVSRMTPQQAEAFAPLLLQTAQQIERLLAH